MALTVYETDNCIPDLLIWEYRLSSPPPPNPPSFPEHVSNRENKMLRCPYFRDDSYFHMSVKR